MVHLLLVFGLATISSTGDLRQEMVDRSIKYGTLGVAAPLISTGLPCAAALFGGLTNDRRLLGDGTLGVEIGLACAATSGSCGSVLGAWSAVRDDDGEGEGGYGVLLAGVPGLVLTIGEAAALLALSDDRGARAETLFILSGITLTALLAVPVTVLGIMAAAPPEPDRTRPERPADDPPEALNQMPY